MSKKLPRGTLDKLGSDPDNWIGLGIYYCKDDPRIIVPKRRKSLGWSMNFANPWVWPTFAIIVVSASLPVSYLKIYNAPVTAAVFIALWIVALVLVCRVMSTTDEHED
jgi:uncharacterized membrane protein